MARSNVIGVGNFSRPSRGFESEQKKILPDKPPCVIGVGYLSQPSPWFSLWTQEITPFHILWTSRSSASLRFIKFWANVAMSANTQNMRTSSSITWILISWHIFGTQIKFEPIVLISPRNCEPMKVGRFTTKLTLLIAPYNMNHNHTVVYFTKLCKKKIMQTLHLKGSMTHLQALQISMKFLLQVTSDIRRILWKL